MKKKIELGTAGGLLLGVFSIFGSFMLEGGRVGALILGPALLIVFGGTLATAMIGTSMQSFKRIGQLFKLTLYPPQHNVWATIDDLVRFATIARKHGLLSLEKEIVEVSNQFLRKIMRFAIDGTDPVVLRSVAELEVNYVNERHHHGAGLFQKMGGYSPTMGIIGTVMGLIAAMASAGEDPNELIHHIAGAFIATLWGVFMANLVWLPIADKLKSIHAEEEHHLQLIVEGVLAIQAGEVPTIVKAKLVSMLPSGEQGTD